MTNIIGDIAGEYKTLLKLVDKMPEGEVISVGDMVDRGPQSKEVLDYFMNTPNTRAIMGNHEHMMLDHITKGGFYGSHIWLWNGGKTTLRSFEPTGELQNPVPTKYLEWLAKLPKYIEIDNCLIAHSFIRGYFQKDDLKVACDLGKTVTDKEETTIIWNRAEPRRRDEWRLQICGHNSQFGLREWRDEEGLFAICLDDSRQRVLTGLHLETMTIYQEDYVE